MYTPWHKLKRGQKYTDHNAILLNMKLDTVHKIENQNKKLFGISGTHKSGISFINLPKMMKIFIIQCLEGK